MSTPEKLRKSLIPAAYRGEQASGDLAGRTVAGWQVGRLLGRGGMGSVYLAQRGGETAVVKSLNPELVANPKVGRRFQREWQALQRVPAHPGLVRILEVPAHEPPVIVLEHVPGESLFAHVRASFRLAPAQAAELIRQVAEALAVVHAAGMLHRDVNPNNIMITPDGRAKVIDFGVVKDTLRSTLTAPGKLVGTALYMAPEQFDGEPPTPAIDVFALGGTLYHALVGRPPFFTTDMTHLIELVTGGDYPPLREAAPGVPLELERVVTQMLDVDPRHRYRKMSDVADDLGRVLRGEPCSAPAFLAGDGWRAPLLGARRFILGSQPGCEIQVEHASVAARHAQVRRESRGWVLYDLVSPGGTYVSGEPVTTVPRVLRSGEPVRLGEAQLTFVDPRAS